LSDVSPDALERVARSAGMGTKDGTRFFHNCDGVWVSFYARDEGRNKAGTISAKAGDRWYNNSAVATINPACAALVHELLEGISAAERGELPPAKAKGTTSGSPKAPPKARRAQAPPSQSTDIVAFDDHGGGWVQVVARDIRTQVVELLRNPLVRDSIVAGELYIVQGKIYPGTGFLRRLPGALGNPTLKSSSFKIVQADYESGVFVVEATVEAYLGDGSVVSSTDIGMCSRDERGKEAKSVKDLLQTAVTRAKNRCYRELFQSPFGASFEELDAEVQREAVNARDFIEAEIVEDPAPAPGPERAGTPGAPAGSDLASRIEGMIVRSMRYTEEDAAKLAPEWAEEYEELSSKVDVPLEKWVSRKL